ncbi:hypothetical protein IV102_28795 [bacterium]|nr:hypothetical protein [bacterium]
MTKNPIQPVEVKLNRLSFYLYLYLLPALVCLAQPHQWLGAVLLVGLTPGLWRSLRRANRRGRLDLRECALFSLTTACLSVVVACVSSLLGWVCLPCWALVALEQAHRRQGRRRWAYSAG